MGEDPLRIRLIQASWGGLLAGIIRPSSVVPPGGSEAPYTVSVKGQVRAA